MKIRAPKNPLPNYLTIAACILLLCIVFPISVKSQTAEQAYEQRMQRLYPSNSREKTKNVENYQKNTPPNLISEQMIYWYFFKTPHKIYGSDKTVKIDAAGSNNLLIGYLKDVYNVDLKRYNEFDRRKIMALAVKQIDSAIATLNDNTEYTCAVLVSDMKDYDFTNHELHFTLRNNRSFLHSFQDFDLFGLNVPAQVSDVSIPINEGDAERVVKHLQNSNVASSVIAVNYFKITPPVLVTRSGRGHLPATVYKIAFYFKEYDNSGKWYYGQKIGEREWGTQAWVHPELR